LLSFPRVGGRLPRQNLRAPSSAPVLINPDDIFADHGLTNCFNGRAAAACLHALLTDDRRSPMSSNDRSQERKSLTLTVICTRYIYAGRLGSW
jgi:hypothetical protein